MPGDQTSKSPAGNGTSKKSNSPSPGPAGRSVSYTHRDGSVTVVREGGAAGSGSAAFGGATSMSMAGGASSMSMAGGQTITRTIIKTSALSEE